MVHTNKNSSHNEQAPRTVSKRFSLTIWDGFTSGNSRHSFSIFIVIIVNRTLQKPNKFIHRTEKRVLKKPVKFYIKFEKYSHFKIL